MPAAKVIQDLRSTLSYINGEIEANVNLPALEQTVGQSLSQGKAGAQILEDVLAAAPLIFPQAEYLVLAVKLIRLVIQLHQANHPAQSLPAAP